jgi:hypothetical protein
MFRAHDILSCADKQGADWRLPAVIVAPARAGSALDTAAVRGSSMARADRVPRDHAIVLHSLMRRTILLPGRRDGRCVAPATAALLLRNSNSVLIANHAGGKDERELRAA